MQTSRRNFLLLLIILSILSCRKSMYLIQLDAEYENILSEVTLTAPDLEANADGALIEFKVGKNKNQYDALEDKYSDDNFYYGEGKYYGTSGEMHTFSYFFHYPYAVAGSGFIFVPVGYSWGGSGVFYYLTAIDKTTLRSVNAVYLGDRINIVRVDLIESLTDTVSIKYTEREADSSYYSSSNTREKRFTVKSKHELVETDPLTNHQRVPQ